MNEPTLTEQVDDIIRHREEFGGPLLNMFAPAVERIVAARVAEAVERERAAWATKVERIERWHASRLGNTDGWTTDDYDSLADAVNHRLRALLSADDTEGKP